MDLDLENIRFRAEHGQSLCLGFHDLAHEERLNEDGHVEHLMTFRCAWVEVESFVVIDNTSQDQSDWIRSQVVAIKERHEREVVNYVLLTLMDELARADDPFAWRGVWHVRHSWSDSDAARGSEGAEEDIVLEHGNLVEDNVGTCGQFMLERRT